MGGGEGEGSGGGGREGEVEKGGVTPLVTSLGVTLVPRHILHSTLERRGLEGWPGSVLDHPQGPGPYGGPWAPMGSPGALWHPMSPYVLSGHPMGLYGTL